MVVVGDQIESAFLVFSLAGIWKKREINARENIVILKRDKMEKFKM